MPRHKNVTSPPTIKIIISMFLFFRQFTPFARPALSSVFFHSFTVYATALASFFLSDFVVCVCCEFSSYHINLIVPSLHSRLSQPIVLAFLLFAFATTAFFLRPKPTQKRFDFSPPLSVVWIFCATHFISFLVGRLIYLRDLRSN